MDEKGGPITEVGISGSEYETRELGRSLAAILREGDVVLIIGEMGTGKTCLAKGLARGLGIGENVLSPTFTLLREYKGRLPLYHLDAYRLEGPWDLFDLGIEEYLEGDGVLVVEWGDRARDFFPGDFLEVRLEFTDREEERRITILPRGEGWLERIGCLPRGRVFFGR
jgi:tRNA threonylcarbamoyladenosine biosynthesis protein TsaE